MVRSDALPTMENFDGRCAQTHFDFAPHERVRDGVEVPPNFDVVIDGDFSPLPFGIFIRLGGKRREAWFVKRLEL